jgi:cytochrome c oxidase subunit 2
MHVAVEAHQFYWLFKYPSGRQSINVLTVPKDLVVNLDVVSADVAHSWWVPAFGGKIDAIPGKTNHTWFKAEKAGTYRIRCAEFCGILHTGMQGFVRVTEPGSRPTAELLGKQAFVGVCASCHGLDGQESVRQLRRARRCRAPRRWATWYGTARGRCRRSETRGTCGWSTRSRAI